MNTVIILTLMVQPGVWKDYTIHHSTHELCHETELMLISASSVEIKLERLMIKDIWENGATGRGILWVGCHQ